MTADPGAQPDPNATPESTDSTTPIEKVVDAPSAAPESKTDADGKPIGTSPPPGASPTKALPTTLNELLDSIPPEVAAGLTSQEIDALAKGDRKAVARILKLPEDTAVTPIAPKTKDEPTPPDPDKGIDRISLRGLSAKDQKQLADIVKSVKEGKYSSLEEAKAAMFPAAKAPDTTTADTTKKEDTEDTPPETNEAIDGITAKIAKLTADLATAETSYNMGEIGKLNREIAKQELALDREKDKLTAEFESSKAAKATAQQAQEKFDTAEAESLDKIAKSHPDLTDDNTPLAKEFLRERIVAEKLEPELFEKPNWSEVLLERVLKSKGTITQPLPPKPGAQRTTLGAIEPPAGTGTPTMSVEEALAKIDEMPDGPEKVKLIDDVIAGVKERDRAAALVRR